MDIQPFARPPRAPARPHGRGGVAVLPTATEKTRNRDAHYPYRADSYFHYLTGFAEPEAVLVLIAGDAPKSILFCRDRDPDKEIWDGYRYGPEGARETFGFDEAHSIAALDEKLPELIADQPALWHSLGVEPEWDARIGRALNAVRAQSRAGKRAPTVDPRPARRARRNAPDQGRPRDRADAPRRRHRRRRASPRHARRRARPLRIRDRGRAPARVPPPGQPVPGLHLHRRLRRQRLRAALRRTTTARCRTANCC